MQNKLLFFGMVALLGGLAVVQFTMRSNQSSTNPSGTSAYQADDAEMQAAIDKARDKLGYFLKVSRQKPAGTQGFSLKVAVEQHNEVSQEHKVEFFWVYPFEEVDGLFAGRINDEPEKIDNVFKGEVIKFSEGQIIDWTFDDSETHIMHGNFTGCIELLREAPDHAAQFMELYGLDCSK